MKRLIALISLCALVLSACQFGEKEPIKIGVIAPMTGGLAALGSDLTNAVNMKVEEINLAGGLDGRPVEVIVEDGRCTGADAASAAQKLIHVDKVVAILGGQCSGETLAAAPIAEAAQIVMLSSISSSPDVTTAGDFVFRNYPSDVLKTEAMARYFKENEISRVAIISENTDFAIGFRDSLKEHMGKEAFVFDEVVDPDTQDFRTLMARLRDADFDVFVPNGQTSPPIASMLEQLREQGLTQLAVGHDVADTIDVPGLAGEAAEGLQVINVPTLSAESEFGVKFITKYGAPQSGLIYAALPYDAMGVLAEAITSVGTDGPAIRDYLYQLEGYDGVVGRFSFDENGDVVGIPYALKEVQGGKFVKISDIEVN